MKALLICPAQRERVAALAESAPLVNLPILGKGLIEYWLEHLATLGATEVQVLATDRPEQVRTLIGDGARWGLHVEVLPERRELSGDEARRKYRADDHPAWLPAPKDVILMDHLPALPEWPLFDSYADWFATVQTWMPRAVTADRVGVREIQPGVWAGLRARISPDAELRAPCWIGEDVHIGAGVVIGPGAVLENKVYVESGAEVSQSVLGPETFVGEWTEVHHSIAAGSTLVNWRLNSCIKVADAFLLCPLRQPRSTFAPNGLLGRLAAALAMLLLVPLALGVMLKTKVRGRAALRPRLAVRPRPSDALPLTGDTLIYYELADTTGWLRRWPQLWNIVRGEFAWVRNRPLSPDQALRLANDFERLWLAAPLGLMSLADAEACAEFPGDEACAHASFYAAQAGWRLDSAIFGRALFRFAFGITYWQVRDYFVGVFQASQVEERSAS